jgi:hypothetical protein
MELLETSAYLTNSKVWTSPKRICRKDLLEMKMVHANLGRLLILISVHSERRIGRMYSLVINLHHSQHYGATQTITFQKSPWNNMKAWRISKLHRLQWLNVGILVSSATKTVPSRNSTFKVESTVVFLLVIKMMIQCIKKKLQVLESTPSTIISYLALTITQLNCGTSIGKS